jgi:hypothetical protein
MREHDEIEFENNKYEDNEEKSLSLKCHHLRITMMRM